MMELNRNLGAGERSYWVNNQYSPNNVTAYCQIDGALNPEHLQSAARCLQKKHPVFQVRILADAKGENPRYTAKQVGELAVKTVSIDKDLFAETLLQYIEQEINSELDTENGPLVRVIYLYSTADKQSAVLITLHHIVADATSAMLALRDLILLYESVRIQGLNNVLSNIRTMPFRPEYEFLFPEHHSGYKAIWPVIRLQLLTEWQRMTLRPGRLKVDQPVEFQQRENHLITRKVDQALSAKLFARCRQQQVTVHGFLTAALAIAIARDINEGCKPRKSVKHISIGSPVSYREQLLPSVADEMGTYVCTLYGFINVAKYTNVWRLGHDISKDISKRSKRGEHFSGLNALKMISPKSVEKSLSTLELIDKKGPGHICMSNIGHFDFPQTVGKSKVTQASWSASLSITGYWLCAVNTSIGKLHLNFSFIKNMVGLHRAMRIVDGMLAIINREASV